MKKLFRFKLKSFLLFVLLVSTMAAYTGHKQAEYLREQSAIDVIQTAATASKSRFEIVSRSNYEPNKVFLY